MLGSTNTLGDFSGHRARKRGARVVACERPQPGRKALPVPVEAEVAAVISICSRSGMDAAVADEGQDRHSRATATSFIMPPSGGVLKPAPGWSPSRGASGLAQGSVRDRDAPVGGDRGPFVSTAARTTLAKLL